MSTATLKLVTDDSTHKAAPALTSLNPQDPLEAVASALQNVKRTVAEGVLSVACAQRNASARNEDAKDNLFRCVLEAHLNGATRDELREIDHDVEAVLDGVLAVLL